MEGTSDDEYVDDKDWEVPQHQFLYFRITLDDCVVNNTINNLTLCSHTDYWVALETIGTDIVGLSGNHVNDFGREGARESLTWYQSNDIPIYGSGFTPEEAWDFVFPQQGSKPMFFDLSSPIQVDQLIGGIAV